MARYLTPFFKQSERNTAGCQHRLSFGDPFKCWGNRAGPSAQVFYRAGKKIQVNLREPYLADNGGRRWTCFHIYSMLSMQVLDGKALGGEGSRTPVLETVVPDFYMLSRSK